MYYAKRFGLAFIFVLGLSACGGGVDMDVFDDMNPSGEDKRPAVEAGSDGTQVSQVSPDFTLSDTLGVSHTLSTELPSTRAVVLYFTMWCPVCDSHMTNMRADIVPDYPDVRFYLVDYVSGSITLSRSMQVDNGYSSFNVLVDTNLELYYRYKASMGTTIVIDSSGVIQMTEDYNNSRLRAALDAL